MLSSWRPCSRVTRAAAAGASGCGVAATDCESSALREVVRSEPIDALAKRASLRSDEFGINATRNRREVCTYDLRLNTQAAAALLALLEGVGFSTAERALCFLS